MQECAWCGGDPQWGDCCRAQHPETIFVFGANQRGAHGLGAALYARNFKGAVMGKGWGLHGRSFAIPTKDKNIQTLPLDRIAEYVQLFLDFAYCTPGLTYAVTRVGCGLAGLTDEQMAPLFTSAPSNVILTPEWIRVLAK